MMRNARDSANEKGGGSLNKVVDFGASFLISGMLAATFKTINAPLERIKLILQTQASSRQMARANETAYSGFLNAVRRIPKQQGFLSLWRGNLTNICRYFPSQAINFSFYDVYYQTLTGAFQPKSQAMRDALSFLAGGSVGVTSCAILYPLTFCTTRIAVDLGDGKNIQREFLSLRDCICKIYKTDGVKGFYQGLLYSVTGMFLYRSTYFGVYTTGKRVYLNDFSFDPTSHKVNAPFFVSLALAQLASTTSTLLAYPLDTIARHSMLHSGQGPNRHMTLRMMSSKILRIDGPVGFYRGILTNLLTTVSGSFILVTYDLIKGFYQRSEEPTFREALGVEGHDLPASTD